MDAGEAIRLDQGAGRLPQALREAQDRFIAAWGQMGGAWGISRTMAEVLALLYITGSPLNTDEIMERLQISRGNASMSVRSLLDWGVVIRTHRRGDRKEYYAAEGDVWALFRAIVRERMKREVDPLLAHLHEIRDLTGVESARRAGRRGVSSADQVAEHNQRLDAMLDFFSTLHKVGHRFAGPAGPGLRLAASLLGARGLGGSRKTADRGERSRDRGSP
jgi:DNA-binding transcriptional regulator GbsR (MarR family)